MKKIYFFLLLGFSLMGYAQEDTETFPQRNLEIRGFKLYPNPATSDVVYIISDTNVRKEVNIFDVFGKLVLTEKISGNSLNISKLSPGVYMVQVTENDSTTNRKLVIK